MHLNYYGVAKENLKSGLDISKISSTTRQKHIDNVYGKKVSDMLDWLDLPDQTIDELDKIKATGDYIAEKFENFVVLGIGGSALGVRMLENTFVSSLHKDVGIKTYVCDNIDSDSFITLLDSLNLKKTMFNVITKSGSTSETLAQMLVVINRYKQKKFDWTEHFIVTTTKGNDLSNWAESNQIPVFNIPKGVGGRFSVLSPVGLLPASVMGINIYELLRGAREERKVSQINGVENTAYTCAYINYTYFKNGLNNLVVMPYSDRLMLVPDFFAQLWSESLGKKVDRKGNLVYTGQTPIKTLGVTDQHSQLQLYSEGSKDKLIMFINVVKNQFDEVIEEEIPLAKHLQGTTLKSLLDYEQLSTAYSLTTLDRPNYSLQLDMVNEYTMGMFIFFMEMMTAFMGEMLGIDTYDQPGVELSKIYTKGCLKLKGYENYGSEIREYLKKNKKFYIK